MRYKQITVADRKAIEVLLNNDFTPQRIATQLGKNKSTVCREIAMRSTPNGYFADIAQLDYERKRRCCGKPCKLKDPSTFSYVLNRIHWGWSPEQISGRMKIENRSDYVCPETIYNFIYTDTYCVKEKLHQYLRYGRRKRHKHYGRAVKRSKIPNKVSIHTRPMEVEKREVIGHWEADSVIYPDRLAINTLNELKTGIVKFTKLNRKTARTTQRAMCRQFLDMHTKTCTVDNGTEFTNHEEITQQTGVPIYFCDPYSSWQRGANENVNMLLRGYLPKGTDIGKLLQKELDDIAYELNNRPRKRLDYKTPLEIYNTELHNLSKEDSVAVESRM